MWEDYPLQHDDEECDMASKDDPQKDFTPQENHGIETQAANPAITNEKGERVDGQDGKAMGAKKDSADGKSSSKSSSKK